MNLQTREETSLLVFGDSHAVIWEGNNVLKRAPQPKFKNVQVRHLGAALAFNLFDVKNNQLGKWGAQIFSELKEFENNRPHTCAIMLCFGEIDIRTQIIKRAVASQSSIASSAFEVVQRLHMFAEHLYDYVRVPILLWEPVPTGSQKKDSYNPAFPTVGSEIERNYATEQFSKMSRELCEESRKRSKLIYSLGIAKRLMVCYETRTEYYEDGCHLNTSGLQIAIEELTKLAEQYDLPNVYSLFVDFKAVSDRTHIRNIAPSVKLTLSSSYATPSTLSRTNRGWCFHTNKDKNPYALIDIGYAAVVESVCIYNRFDACADRCKSLSVYAGLDLQKLINLHNSTEVWGSDGTPIVLGIPDQLGPIRFILLQLRNEEFFHLGEVQIFEQSFLI